MHIFIIHRSFVFRSCDSTIIRLLHYLVSPKKILELVSALDYAFLCVPGSYKIKMDNVSFATFKIFIVSLKVQACGGQLEPVHIYSRSASRTWSCQQLRDSFESAHDTGSLFNFRGSFSVFSFFINQRPVITVETSISCSNTAIERSLKRTGGIRGCCRDRDIRLHQQADSLDVSILAAFGVDIVRMQHGDPASLGPIELDDTDAFLALWTGAAGTTRAATSMAVPATAATVRKRSSASANIPLRVVHRRSFADVILQGRNAS